MIVGLVFTSPTNISADTGGGVGHTFEETFSDSALANLIAEKCNKDITNTITDADINSLTSLFLINNGIQSITGIHYLTNLQTLNLSDNQIEDVTPLGNLTNLKYLYLDHNQIKDISPLANIGTNLFRLYLQYNQITDISALASLSNLGELYIHNNQIRTLSPLTNLEKLGDLRIASNEINDVSPLATMNDFSYLDLADNHISDITPLANVNVSGHLLLDRQTITNEAIPYKNPLIINNSITSIDGTLISPYMISNSGTHDNGKLIWSNVTENTTSTSFQFKQSVTIGSATGNFAGVVTQPITAAEEELSTTVTIKGKIYLTNKELENGMFTFVIENEEGSNIATVTNDRMGNINFGELLYTETGEYIYTIKEVNDAQENILYDATKFKVTVIVTKVGNALVAEVAGDLIIFNNTYVPAEVIVPKKPDIPTTPDTPNSKNNTTATTASAKNVQTGDTTNPLLFILSIGISISILIVNRKKVYK